MRGDSPTFRAARSRQADAGVNPAPRSTIHAPVTGAQHDAMLAMRGAGLRRDRAGWGTPLGQLVSGLWRCTTQTLLGLERRGLCRLNPKRGTATLTAAGKRHLRLQGRLP